MKCSCQLQGKSCIDIVPIFSGLSEQERMEVARITTDRTFERGEMIYLSGEKGERLYVVHRGKVKVTRSTDDGREQVIRVLGPGEFMGELSLFSAAPLTDNSEAIEKTTVCMIEGEPIRKLMIRYPAIAFKVMEELSKRLEKAEGMIEKINLHDAEKRLVQALVLAAGEGDEVVLKMSKRDFASQLGMSQETLSRKLSALQEAGLIQQKGHRRITLLDKGALSEME